MARSNKKDDARSFHQDLVLNRWMMRFFKNGSISTFKQCLSGDHLEGIEGFGAGACTKFVSQLNYLIEPQRISIDDLDKYDKRIVRFWQEITEERNRKEGHVLHMKYFQYLSLLFSEIYLDWYFNSRQLLIEGLNKELEIYRTEKDSLDLQPFVDDDLNRIAFWNATGSGKTLLLHVNIKQYLHYFQKANNDSFPSSIILLTPNEGLSKQHLEELKLSGFTMAGLFNPSSPSSLKGNIDIIDIHKLGDEDGDKVVAVDTFEGNNLVLIDEGHRGAGNTAKAWMSRREILLRGGFGFEYSATFGQAVSKGKTITEMVDAYKKEKAKIIKGVTKLKDLDKEFIEQVDLDIDDMADIRANASKEIYAKCILFDYSYRYFYDDGYGKDSLILNMKEDEYADSAKSKKYLTACLLAFYQQQWLWAQNSVEYGDYNIEKPLWVFVGNTVNDSSSDILEVVKYLAYFLANGATIKSWLDDIIKHDKALLLDKNNNDVFSGRFMPLKSFNGDASDIYNDILQRLFNTNSPQRLKIVNIRNAKGELALRVGESEPFGLISVGDGAGVFKHAEALEEIDVESDEFSEALFSSLDKSCSKLNMLIGSRKFIEGWSSWRVSTMGLLNMGRGVGSQIIQLFGRGIRLKGKDFSLKRSGSKSGVTYLEKLETLNIFGIRADYMAKFKEYLREEGVTLSDEIIELSFPARSNLPKKKLKTLALDKQYAGHGKYAYKRMKFPEVFDIPDEYQGKIKTPHITVDLYPKIEALSSMKEGAQQHEARHSQKLDEKVLGLFDFDRIYLAVHNYKVQNGKTNLRMNKRRLIEFCTTQNDWYTLFIPSTDLQVAKFSDIRKQEDILIRLLCDYLDRYYLVLQQAYEGQYYKVVEIDEDHSALLDSYCFEIKDDDDVECSPKTKPSVMLVLR
jgi:hypothetical protein